LAGWTREELDKLVAREEIDVAPRNPDGELGRRVTVWAVGHGDALYVRSAVKGRSAAWYRGVKKTHAGRLWGGRLVKDVTFADDHSVNDELDSAYRKKYVRYGGIVDSCLTAEARATTLRVMPAQKR
jgi:hypothetical protein